ncbi:MAG TPA: hypothetical protein VGN14_13980 [Candidatus Elarobacter sp.]
MGIYGPKATIGYIGPPRTNETVLYEAMRIAPEGVAWCWSTMGLPEFGQYQFDDALNAATICAKELAAREVDVIVVTGIPLMTSKETGYHERLEQELSDAIGGTVPVTSDVRCSLAALAAMNMKQIVLASIYQRYIQDNVIRYFGGYGVRVLADVALEYALADCMKNPTWDTAPDAMLQAYAKAPEADGIFVGCTQWPVVGGVPRVEEQIGKPVVSHMASILWGALAKIGVDGSREGYGRLMREWPAWSEPKLAAPAA